MSICRQKPIETFAKDKYYRKARGHCHDTGKYRAAAHNICNLSFNVPNNIFVVFRNGSNYDYHLFNKLAIAFEGRFECQNLFCFNRKIIEKC